MLPCRGPVEIEPLRPRFHADQEAILCILSRGSSPSECGACDAECVLDLLGRIQSSSIFSGFCLIRVIKQQDSRFITLESSLFAVVQSFHLCSDPFIQLPPYFRDSPTEKQYQSAKPKGFSLHPVCNSESVAFLLYCFSSHTIATTVISISYQPSA